MFETEKAYSIEHALNMYAEDYIYLPASEIYNTQAIAPLMDRIKECHIYFIGHSPKVNFEGASQSGNTLTLHFSMVSTKYKVQMAMPDGYQLKTITLEGKKTYHLEDPSKQKIFFDEAYLQCLLNQVHNVPFDVLYIGQAYGKLGSRNALDRLIKHETLQKIALKPVPVDHALQIVMFKIVQANRVITMFNPHANNSGSNQRIEMGLKKLYETTEIENITLFEASMIRHFEPIYNKEFKNSFPSTNLKILKDCYDKDFSAVISEICFEEIPIGFKSSKIPYKLFIISEHDLHEELDRKVFFSLD